MATLGDLVINIGANAADFNAATKSVRNELSSVANQARTTAATVQSSFGPRLGAGLRGLASGFSGLLGALGVSLTGAGIVAGLTASINAAREAEAAQMKLQAVLRSTGGAAGFTAAKLSEYAAELQKTTNFGDDTTIGAMALLATFTEVNGSVFKDATALAQDMASVMGTDLNAAIMQIGKALNDPVKGVTALRKNGVSFTQEQQEQIKALVESNDLLGAQKIILAELATEFGGAAAAMRDPVSQLSENWGDLVEVIGKELLPYVGLLSETISGWAVGAQGDVNGLRDAIGGVMDFVQKLTALWQFLSAFIRTAMAVSLTQFHAVMGLIPGLGEATAFVGNLIDELDALAKQDIAEGIKGWNAEPWSEQAAEFQQGLDESRAKAKGLQQDLAEIPETIKESVSEAAKLAQALAGDLATFGMTGRQRQIAELEQDPFVMGDPVQAALVQQAKETAGILDRMETAQKARTDAESAAKSLTDRYQSPQEEARQQAAEMGRLLGQGLLSPEVMGRGLSELAKGIMPEAKDKPGPMFAGAIEKGTTQAWDFIAQAMGQKQQQDWEKEQAKQLAQAVAYLRDIAGKAQSTAPPLEIPPA